MEAAGAAAMAALMLGHGHGQACTQTAASAPSTVLQGGAAISESRSQMTAELPSLQLLPEELFESILGHLLAQNSDLPTGPKKPLPQLCSTDQATRTAVLQWQRSGKGAAEEAQIGAANLKLAVDDVDGLRALEELTLRFPRDAKLRRLGIELGTPGGASESRLVDFMSQPGAGEKLATVAVLEVWTKQWQTTRSSGQTPLIFLSAAALSAVCLACPSLSSLKLRVGIQRLSSLLPLHQLRYLKELVIGESAISAPDDEDDEDEPISANDLAALCGLTSLTKLSIVTSDAPLSTLLPGLSSLACLTDFIIDTMELSIPGFASLCSLQHLTRLQWTDETATQAFDLYDTSLSAICSCTQIVSLEIPHGLNAPQLQRLLRLPRLKSLGLRQLDLSGCSLETLALRLADVSSCRDLSELLPLCRAVYDTDLPDHVKNCWDLPASDIESDDDSDSDGGSDSNEEVSAVARRVGAASRALREISASCGRVVQELCLSGSTRGRLSSLASVIAALRPLGEHMRCITLDDCGELDEAVMEQLAEALPGLEELWLGYCSVNPGAWKGLLRLTHLSSIAVYGEYGPSATAEGVEGLVGFAVAVQRDVTIEVTESFMSAEEVARCQQAVEERRRAAGASGCVRMTGGWL